MENEDLNELASKYGSDLYNIETMAEEIIAYTGEPEAQVWRRLALELHRPGANVNAEIARFGVTPHVFSDNLIRFYTESDGFIYETCIGSSTPFRIKKWLKIAGLYQEKCKSPDQCHILLYGDSIGNDSIFLGRMGFNVYYHDFDSYCSRFAKERFRKRNLVVHDFQPNEPRKFDFIICFEVAEHVPNPPELIEELAKLTAPDGYCIFSEAFGMIEPSVPTHLASNAQYVRKADSLFAQHGMHVAWRDLHEKPIVYTRLRGVSEDYVSPMLKATREAYHAFRHLVRVSIQALVFLILRRRWTPR